MINIVGTPAMAATTTVAIPAHQPGDMIIIAARGTSAPSRPAQSGTVPNWIIEQTGAANSLGLVTAAAIATGSNHTSGTWTNANGIAAIILRSDTGTLADGASSTGNANNDAALVYPALTLDNTDGTSTGVRVGTRTATGAWTAPTNWTNRVAQPAGNNALLHVNTRAELAANIPTDTVTIARAAWRAHTFEVIEIPPHVRTKVWTGDEWAACDVKCWSGNAWAPLKVWDHDHWRTL